MRGLLLLMALAAACSHATAGEPTAPAPRAEDARDQSAQRKATSPKQASGGQAAATAAPSPLPQARPYFALAEHLERAEVRQGGALWMDYGVRGDAKYTLGGWLTGTGSAVELDGASARIVPGKVVKVILPAESGGSARLSLRLRSFTASTLTIYVNSETVRDTKLSGEEFQQVDLPLAAGLLKEGDNDLQLRVGRRGAAKGVGQAGLAIDWIRLEPPTASAAPSPPAAASALHSVQADSQRLHLTQGLSLGYGLQIPAQAELRALGASEGSLRVRALRDGAPPHDLGTHALRPGSALRVDLGALSDEMVRLDLTSTKGDVVLADPLVVVRDERPARSLPKPIKNVVIVLVDTLRADKLSPYNPQTRVKTPGLTTFLRDASVMRNARTQENWTKPSVATLLSSLLPWQHNAVTGEARVPRSVELLPELLRERGFYTGSFIANGYVSDKFGFKQGWHTYRNYIREGRRTRAQYVAADVLDWLDRRPQDKPFFLYMHTIDPHVPYKPPKHFLSMYDEADYRGVVDFRATSSLLEKIKVGNIRLKPRDKQRLMALYDAEISYHDVHFAAVMEGLNKRGIADETMVIVTSDHGEEFWDHGSVGHGHSVYDELLRIPMIVKLPGVTQAATSFSDAVGLVDVMPTVLDALGQAKPQDLAGTSFLPQLLGQGTRAPRTAVSGFMRGWRTVGSGRMKLIQRTLKKRWLYDVQQDPGETQDLADSRPLALRYMRGLLGLSLAQQQGSHRPRPRRVHKRENVVIDKKTKAQLEALGYVGSSAK